MPPTSPILALSCLSPVQVTNFDWITKPLFVRRLYHQVTRPTWLRGSENHEPLREIRKTVYLGSYGF